MATDPNWVFENHEEAAKLIDRLQAAVLAEAEYCYLWMRESEKKGDSNRALRHKERGDRLTSHITNAPKILQLTERQKRLIAFGMRRHMHNCYSKADTAAQQANGEAAMKQFQDEGKEIEEILTLIEVSLL